MIFAFSFSSRFINLYFPQRLFETELLRILGICSQGFYVFLSFGLTIKNLKSWKNLIVKILFCKKDEIQETGIYGSVNS